MKLANFRPKSYVCKFMEASYGMYIRVSQKNNFFEKYRWSGLIWFS